jgi:hypothetical protein
MKRVCFSIVHVRNEQKNAWRLSDNKIVKGMKCRLGRDGTYSLSRRKRSSEEKADTLAKRTTG